ncbi:hypothetical protein GALL_115400 [mine drainage metagenome]|uniref:Alpha/beta hydrolase family protein n=1 Tax=mine drainage metagenome TaxID=410659 RepID=A0A1J5T2D6_9ZZZZ
MKRGWLCGWGVDCGAFEACCRAHFPGEVPQVEPATWRGWARLRAAGCDAFGGFSLGAWLLLRAAKRGEAAGGDVVLLAPFLAFPAEAGFGGRVKRVQLERVRRWLRTDPEGALVDFGRRSGLDLPLAKPACREELEEGLAWLDSTEIDAIPDAACGWRAYVGDHDTLLEPQVVSPWRFGTVVAGAGHQASALMAADGLRRTEEVVP